MNKKQLRVLVLVPLLIGSFTVIPPLTMTDTVSASHNCDTSDAAVYAFSFTYVNNDKCGNNHVEHAVEEVREAEGEKTKVDIYSAAGAQKDSEELQQTITDNYLQDTESVAWMKAEVAMAEAYKNGSSKTQTKVAAKEAIAKYYSQKQLNLIKSWNSSTTSAKYLTNRSKQEGTISGAYTHVSFTNYDDYGYQDYESGDYHYELKLNSQDVQLVNGSNAPSQTLYLHADWSGHSNSHDFHHIKVNDGNVTWNANGQGGKGDFDGTYGQRFYEVEIWAPNSNYDDMSYLNFEKYKSQWNKIETQNNELQNESDQFIEQVWTSLENGEIDSTELISRNTQMFEYGTAASENGSYYDIIGATAGMGIATPELNSTGSMTIKYEGNTMNGMLFGNAPNGTWDVGTTYNTSNFNNTVMFASTTGKLEELNGEFTLTEATDKEGNEQDTVVTKEYNYKTANSSELKSQMDSLLALTQELEDRSASVGGSGTSSSNNRILQWFKGNTFGIPNAIIALVAIVGVSVANKRRN